MISLRIPTSAFVILLAFAVAASAAEPPAAPQSPAQLVESLGDKSFRVREAAAKRLASMGADARVALEAGRKSPDKETADRCAQLLASLGENDRLARIDRFEKADPGTDAADLPFWKLFCDAVGDTKPSRRDFARLMRVHREELERLQADGRKLSDSHVNRLWDFAKRSAKFDPNAATLSLEGVEADDLCILFLIGCDPRTPDNPKLYKMEFVLWDPLFLRGVTDPKGSPTMRKLFARWSRTQTNYRLLMETLRTMRKHQMPECFETGMAIYAREKKGKAVFAALGLFTAGLAATRHQQKVFRDLLADSTLVGEPDFPLDGGNVRMRIEMRDIALAALIRLDGQEYREYGIPAFRIIDLKQPYEFHHFGYENDDQRTSTRKLWETRHANIERLRTVWAW